MHQCCILTKQKLFETTVCLQLCVFPFPVKHDDASVQEIVSKSVAEALMHRALTSTQCNTLWMSWNMRTGPHHLRTQQRSCAASYYI